jgi:hypothetical protein
VSRMCANVGNAARTTHNQTRGEVYFPASQGVAGQLGNSPNFSAILGFSKSFTFALYSSMLWPVKNTVGYHGNQRLGTGRLWLGSNSK